MSTVPPEFDVKTGHRLGKRKLREIWQPYREATLGFRNYWYPICFRRELDGGRPKMMTICGEDLLLREVDGKVYAVEDRCAHRRVPISQRVRSGADQEVECHTKDTVTCWYHGFTYSFRDGRLVQNITWPDCSYVGKIAIKTYPIQEAKGLVFVWIGDETPGEIAADVVPSFIDDDMVIEGRVQVVPACWRWGAENGFDSTHIYMHRNSILLENAKLALPLGLVPKDLTGGQARVHTGPGRVGASEDLAEDYEPVWDVDIGKPEEGGVRLEAAIPEGEFTPAAPLLSMWLPCMAGVEPFPVPGINVYESYVPIDEKSHQYFQLLGKRCANDAEAEAFRKEVKDRWEHYLQDGFNQDDVIARQGLEDAYTKGNGWLEETLIEQDLCIFLWRNLASRYNRGINRRPQSLV